MNRRQRHAKARRLRIEEADREADRIALQGSQQNSQGRGGTESNPAESHSTQSCVQGTPHATDARYVRLPNGLTVAQDARLTARAVRWQEKPRYPVDRTKADVEAEIAARGEATFAEKAILAASTLIDLEDPKYKALGSRTIVAMSRQVQIDDHAVFRQTESDFPAPIGPSPQSAAVAVQNNIQINNSQPVQPAPTVQDVVKELIRSGASKRISAELGRSGGEDREPGSLCSSREPGEVVASPAHAEDGRGDS